MENLQTRLNEVARIAVRLDQQTGCPAQLLIAQWAIESAWGEKPVGHANYFGIKRAARHTQWCIVETREVVGGKSVVENLEFADYDSLEDSCRDYAWPSVNTSKPAINDHFKTGQRSRTQDMKLFYRAEATSGKLFLISLLTHRAPSRPEGGRGNAFVFPS